MRTKGNKPLHVDLQNEKLFFRELFHPFHQEDLTKVPLPGVTVQQKHSKEGSQRHYHEHGHPSVEISTYRNQKNTKPVLTNETYPHWRKR